MILKVYHTHGMQEDTKALSTSKHVAILTHDDFIGNIVEMQLTQLFQDIGLTFEIVSLAKDVRGGYDMEKGDFRGELTLMRKPYSKKIVNEVEKLKGITSDLLIILSHGKKTGLSMPSAVCFAPEEMTSVPAGLLLWACNTSVLPPNGAVAPLPDGCVTLGEVTISSRLAIVLCCHGDDILGDFKSMKTENFTDMLVCNREDMDIRSFCIFFVLLANLVDRDKQVRTSRTPQMHVVVKYHIRKIFEDVKAFGQDKDTFWAFLHDRGLVSENGDKFRVSGILYSFELIKGSEDKKAIILQDFKALTLVCWDKKTGNVVEENWDTQPLHNPRLLPGKRKADMSLAVLLESLQLSVPRTRDVDTDAVMRR